MSTQKGMHFLIDLPLYEAFLREFPFRGERSQFLRRVIQLTLEHIEEKDRLARLVALEIAEEVLDSYEESS